MTEHLMTCAEVDSVLLDYLEETLDSATRSLVDEHAAGCLRCHSLLRDIDSIQTEAARLPELAPSRDLWAGIAARIEPTVVPLGRTPQERNRRWIPAAAAAAAALVIATAGITYVATSRALRPAEQRVAVATQPAVVVNPPAIVDAPEMAVASREPAEVAAAPQASAETSATPRAVREPAARRASTGASLASRSNARVLTPTEIAYGDEISRLQAIITERRRELDPSTVTVVEQSLKIIDAAVQQSRAALARDPKSGFLSDQLNHALDKKVELLRTVALLPSRT
ncbi:MAG TPA: hypothetical protein VM099_03460 [Gemmatimonadaceae bacterium]|nr:hypothetical protein [Gemmatimonadaceae bacterium]